MVVSKLKPNIEIKGFSIQSADLILNLLICKEISFCRCLFPSKPFDLKPINNSEVTKITFEK